jgi:hypothetical protein
MAVIGMMMIVMGGDMAMAIVTAVAMMMNATHNGSGQLFCQCAPWFTHHPFMCSKSIRSQSISAIMIMAAIAANIPTAWWWVIGCRIVMARRVYSLMVAGGW